ncbi:hypothetical protein B0H14DRAFT_3006942 [Mycena olivaceomarginata]|nr:hypothetical protein B0H14DRAFT_3006942 [Mycena olivaceomarginata]
MWGEPFFVSRCRFSSSLLYTLLFASAASSGMYFQSDDPPTTMYCYSIHGVVLTWVVAISRLVYAVDPPGGFDSP